jgi:hypothetical protein
VNENRALGQVFRHSLRIARAKPFARVRFEAWMNI